MTWHEYQQNGVGPTAWFIAISAIWVYVALSSARDMTRRTKRAKPWVRVAVSATWGPLLVGLVCYGALVTRVEDQRRLIAQAAAHTNSYVSPPARGGYGSTGGGYGYPGGLSPTARCADGTFSYSAHHQGTCSHHGGVAQWLDSQPQQVAAITPPPAAEPAPQETTPPARTAYETVTGFFQAINAKDWPTVWALGGRNFGHTYKEMVGGYSHTDHDAVSIYADDGSLVQVAVLARETSGVTQLYLGKYTVQSGEITQGSLVLQATDSGSDFGSFAGTWGGHGRGLEVTSGGLGVISFRTYRACATSPAPPPCDAQDGNVVVDGGLTTFRLTSATGNHATGQLLGTAGSRGTIDLQLDQGGNVVRVTGFEGAPFCKAGAPPNTCGA